MSQVTKAELRKTYLKWKKSLSDEEARVKSREITELFFAQFNLQNVRNLHIFLSIPAASEIDTTCLIKRLWAEFRQIKTIVPRINRETDRLESVEYNSQSKLVTNSWGIREPSENKLVAPENIDLVIVPLLCFDRRGHRVGYGKGYYDKFLAECRPGCVKVGVSYFEPVDEISDIHGGDVKLDRVVTPEKVWKF